MFITAFTSARQLSLSWVVPSHHGMLLPQVEDGGTAANMKGSCVYFGAWGGVVVKELRYYSDGPGIDCRWSHWGFLPWYPRQNHVPWGRLSLWKWVPGISPGIKAAGAFGWRPTTLVVPKSQENPELLTYPKPLGPPHPVAGDLYFSCVYFE